MSALFQSQTIEQIANLIQASDLPVMHRSLVPLHSEGEAAPLFIVHAVGGGVMGYMDLARELGKFDRPVYGLQAEGFYNKEAKPQTIESMATHYIEEILSVQSSGVFHLAGWSFGGAVAFEMAKQLLARGHTVSPLLLLDSFAPSLFTQKAGFEKQKKGKVLMSFLMDLSGTLQKPLLLSHKELVGLSLDEQFEIIKDALLKTHLISSEEGMEDIKHHFDIFLNHSNELYRYEVCSLPVGIVLLAAKERRADKRKMKSDKTLGWGAVVDRVVVKLVSGTHYTMLHKKNAVKLARMISKLLSK